MAATRREASYTPDFTHNLLHFVNLTGTQFLSEHLLLAANAYYRHLITGSSNGSNNDNYLNENYPGPPLDCSVPPADRLMIAYCSSAAKLGPTPIVTPLTVSRCNYVPGSGSAIPIAKVLCTR